MHNKHKSTRQREMPNRPDLLHQQTMWEQTLKSIREIEKIGQHNQRAFAELLSKESDPDSYLTSPAYYNFTGRKGLWIFHAGQSYIPLCIHPNNPGEVLIFPARGPADSTALNKLLDIMPVPPRGARLARVKTQPLIELGDRDMRLVPVIENVLDWKFPVRILSTRKLAAMSESAFKRIRNRIRKAEAYDITAEPLSPSNAQGAKNFVKSWAKSYLQESTVTNFTAPYFSMLDQFDGDEPNGIGRVYRVAGRVVGFTIWDVSNAESPTANRHVNLCSSSFVGLSDYIMRSTARELVAQDIEYLNIGGSETKSLDNYKTKFLPIQSIDLCSVKIVTEDELDISAKRNLFTSRASFPWQAAL